VGGGGGNPRRVGRLDILGTTRAGRKTAEKVARGSFDLTVAVNLKGTSLRANGGRAMIRTREREDINMSSQAGFAALPTEIDLLHDQGGD